MPLRSWILEQHKEAPKLRPRGRTRKGKAKDGRRGMDRNKRKMTR